MRVILFYYLYMEVVYGGFGFDKSIVVVIMFIYGFFVYMLSVIGGWLVDWVFGMVNIVFYGGILIMFGYIVFVFFGSMVVFFFSMVLIIIGIGLFKLNVFSVVGDLYMKEDECCDFGFSIFYMGINFGGLVVLLIVGIFG